MPASTSDFHSFGPSSVVTALSIQTPTIWLLLWNLYKFSLVAQEGWQLTPLLQASVTSDGGSKSSGSLEYRNINLAWSDSKVLALAS
jgi:hypothetical protein